MHVRVYTREYSEGNVIRACRTMRLFLRPRSRGRLFIGGHMPLSEALLRISHPLQRQQKRKIAEKDALLLLGIYYTRLLY